MGKILENEDVLHKEAKRLNKLIKHINEFDDIIETIESDMILYKVTSIWQFIKYSEILHKLTSNMESVKEVFKINLCIIYLIKNMLIEFESPYKSDSINIFYDSLEVLHLFESHVLDIKII